jgi:hypothetical protein
LFCFVFVFVFFFGLFFGEFAIAVGFERIGIPGLLVAAEKGGREAGRVEGRERVSYGGT